MADSTVVQEEIQALIDAPLGAGSQAALEHALTGGYAQALALEAERGRLGRRLGEVAASYAREAGGPDELAGLAGRIEEIDRDLAQLRMLLLALKARFDQARAAA